jgi:hypothetical protein
MAPRIGDVPRRRQGLAVIVRNILLRGQPVAVGLGALAGIDLLVGESIELETSSLRDGLALRRIWTRLSLRGAIQRTPCTLFGM